MGATFFGVVGQLPGGAGLSDSRLAHEHHNLPMAIASLFQGCQQPRHLLLSPQESLGVGLGQRFSPDR
jgi:hypothetical protein